LTLLGPRLDDRDVSESIETSIFGEAYTPGQSSVANIEAPNRGPIYGAKGVAADHPLSAQAGMQMLQRGGNAIDAAIAAAAVNAVVKPYQTQFGGDAFALVWHKRTNEVSCLNAGGLAPQAATLERFAKGIPSYGAASCAVPGFVDALLELYAGYATMPLEKLLEPAMRAAEGFPVSKRLSQAMELIPGYKDAEVAELKRVFLKDGRPYAPGETLRQPELVALMQGIVDAENQREGFYDGEVGAKIVAALQQHGGAIEIADFKDKVALFEDPLQTTYRDCDVYEQALPSQGIILLMALNIVEQFPLADWGVGNADAMHVLVEATKLAFADSRRYSADPKVVDVPFERLLSKEHAKLRAAAIDMKLAKRFEGAVLPSDTTELVAGDEDYAVALIQSVFSNWGSRFVVPGTGILMNNRLRAFSTDPSAANALAPGKRTVHTLNTFMMLRDGALVVGGGTPGMDFQVQNNLQTVVGVRDWGLDLQSALDMPRWVSLHDGTLALEGRFNAAYQADLTSRGHALHVLPAWDSHLARSQVLASTPEGGWAFGSDLRGEGIALAE
jgi:gamma-glutamyltranspeptidase/glutathione hydrolase